MPLFHLRVPVINSLVPTAGINHGTGVTIIAVQPVVPLRANHPYDRVISSISGCNPWRTLAALACSPGERRSLADLSQ